MSWLPVLNPNQRAGVRETIPRLPALVCPALPVASSASSSRTKGQVEAAITEALSRFERDYLGRGPEVAHAFVVRDLVLVRMKGILSPAERHLSGEPGGVEIIKTMRSRLIESCSDELEAIVAKETGVAVVTMHTDISAQTGERVFVFGLAEDLEAKL